MKFSPRVRRYTPAAIAFTLVALGATAALPDSGEKASERPQVPVVVAAASLRSGVTAADVMRQAEVRMVDDSLVADGALASLDDIPDGVLAFPVVRGQQLVSSSFAEDEVAALGNDFVSVAVDLDAQRWVGPLLTSGTVVDVYDVGVDGATLIANDAVVMEHPEVTEALPGQDALVTLGVPKASLPLVLQSAGLGQIWLVGQ
jgi:hypothetical protein